MRNMFLTLMFAGSLFAANTLHVSSVSDDGAGINTDELLTKAKELNLEIEKEASKKELLNLIFHPKFSTAKNITEISGQGMGMNAVYEIIKSKGGEIEVYTIPNEGTTFSISIPLQHS